jgi:hypothetical protein
MIDIAAGSCAVIGMALVGDKSIWCFAFFAACNILWIVHAIQTSTWGLLIECPVGLALCIRNFEKWRSREN